MHPYTTTPSFLPSSANRLSTNMASSSSPTSSSARPLGSEHKKPFAISTLMSPPELPPFESFAQSTVGRAMDQVTSELRKAPGPNPPLSPPISPLVKSSDEHASSPASSTPTRDPILYPSQDVSSSPPQPPLFVRDDSVSESSVDARRIVDDHVVARPASLFHESAPPQREEYELMLFFKSQVMRKYQANPKGWLQRERAQLLADRKAGARHNQFRLHPILAAKPQPIRTQIQRIAKPPRAPTRQLPTVALPSPRQIRTNFSPPVATPARQTAIRRISATPDPATRRAAAPSREDKDFKSLPDYCPPLSSLPARANSLKVDWKGAPIDLDSDPNRGLLHPDEVALAANLRLDCATYLTSKRRMFIARLNCLRIGKEFRKTDAQQACKIDVNKASKLWTAFEKVGWLDKRWVAQYL